MKHLKSEVIAACEAIISSKLKSVQETLANLQESLFSETKSTAGDKHETGRSMVQLEMEKTGAKVLELEKELAVLDRIKKQENQQQKLVRLGSLLETSNGIYFIAVSLGLVKIENHQVFAISSGAPIAKEFIGKTAGETVSFRNTSITIQTIF
ncbi:hypothetical protein SAMN05216480_101232 [Pustulibacterium marinum]|uniref:3-oxoacyl-ACP synthase n=1 Tax=Pustulibacterium marinum TaxID=1224947 RepID=A0A1I7EUL7_9FLAO|nr:hypothetical protein [Pustulibacterium marinum]SFU27593.1 hypothetical protein SAMN05216480_101232 [Pustulibacterium marinum]